MAMASHHQNFFHLSSFTFRRNLRYFTEAWRLIFMDHFCGRLGLCISIFLSAFPSALLNAVAQIHRTTNLQIFNTTGPSDVTSDLFHILAPILLSRFSFSALSNQYLQYVREKGMERLANLGIDMVEKSYINFEKNLKLLEADMQRLTYRASDVENEVTVAEGPGKKKRKREVEDWLENVKKVEDDFIALKTEYQVQGFLRNPLRGNRIAELQGQVAGLLEQSQHFNELVLETTENRGMPRITFKLFGQLFQKNFDEILECLQSDKISRVGVYGMGGVGKSTLVKHVHNHLLKNTNSKVHWFTISQEFNIKRLQNEIAKVINLDLSNEEDEDIRAFLLSSGLTKIKNLVITLDDVWECICFEKVGIPLGMNGCKVIMTSRSSKLCDQMRCERKFWVNSLDGDDAWELFKYKLGLETTLQEDIEKIAKSIVKRCDGLPLGIITMAGSMMGAKDIHDWSDALEQLKSCQEANSVLDQEVLPILGLSYSRLNRWQQNCLLYCSLYPEDYLIPKTALIGKFISAGILQKRKTRKQEFDQGHGILNELVKVCLLEESKGSNDKFLNMGCDDKFIKMHDLIRDMALCITSKETALLTSGAKPRFMVKAGMRLTEIPEQNEWAEDLELVSLMDNVVEEISSDISPNCPKLSFLTFEKCFFRCSIPNSFFEKLISSLKVLDLSGTHIMELPCCVSDMENLTALFLRETLIDYLPPLGKLKKLRELDICTTNFLNFLYIPQDLEKLESLRVFSSRTIPVGILPKLYRLQSLHLGCVDDVSEVVKLKHLEDLFLHAPVAAYIQLVKTLERISAYYIWVHGTASLPGEALVWWGSPKHLPFGGTLLCLGSCIIDNEGDTKANGFLLPENIQGLRVENCVSSAKYLSDIFPRLEYLKVLVSCVILSPFENVEYILRLSSIASSSEQHASIGCAPLHRLEDLELWGLRNLVGLIKWEPEVQSYCLPRGTFSNLKCFCLSRCNKIRTVFLPSWLKNLQNLEILCLKCCHNLEEVIAENEMRDLEQFSSGTISAVLPKLKVIQLCDLPELKSIYSGSMTSDSISEIVVVRCPELKRLPFSLTTIYGQLSCPTNLKEIKGSEEWWHSLEWDNPFAKIALQPKFLVWEGYAAEAWQPFTCQYNQV